MTYDLAGKRVWVAGHRGMVGSAIVRRLQSENCTVLMVGRDKLDLRRQDAVDAWVQENRPQAVFIAAAKVGGILANNNQPVDFLYDNVTSAVNVIHGCARIGVEKLVFLSSSCVYPKFAPQPMAEECLLTGALEPTNQWYAIAKIAAMKLAEAYRKQDGRDFISVMPTNLYGPNDNFDLTTSHVLPALIAKTHAAKIRGDESMEIWGSGSPRREFLHVDDAADAIVHVMKTYSGDLPINIGSGEDLTIAELAKLVAGAVGFAGALRYDRSKPDGTPRKMLDISRLRGLGWKPALTLEQGVASTYRWYVNNLTSLAGVSGGARIDLLSQR